MGTDPHGRAQRQEAEVTTDPRTITRPDDSLLTYYVLVSLCALLAFPIVFIPRYIRFKTLRYEFDDEGVKMSWGFFFHREVYLTYRRIQDIHVNRNIAVDGACEGAHPDGVRDLRTHDADRGDPESRAAP